MSVDFVGSGRQRNQDEQVQLANPRRGADALTTRRSMSLAETHSIARLAVNQGTDDAMANSTCKKREFIKDEMAMWRAWSSA